MVSTLPVLPNNTFEWSHTLEENWGTILEELEVVLKDRERIPNFQDILENQKTITNDDNWKTYFLYGFGIKNKKNCTKCPETTKLLENITGMKSAFFSILSPGKKIPPHRGFYKGFVRYHLGLIIPQESKKCYIQIANQKAYWEPGKSLIFDDTYTHHVQNNTEEERVILFLDIMRPLRFPYMFINYIAMNLLRRIPVIKKSKTNLIRWNDGV